jgi:hypothetical protein
MPNSTIRAVQPHVPTTDLAPFLGQQTVARAMMRDDGGS